MQDEAPDNEIKLNLALTKDDNKAESSNAHGISPANQGSNSRNSRRHKPKISEYATVCKVVNVYFLNHLVEVKVFSTDDYQSFLQRVSLISLI